MAQVEYQVTEATANEFKQIEEWGWKHSKDASGEDRWEKQGKCPRCGHTITKTLEISHTALSAAFSLPDRMVAESYATSTGKASLMADVPTQVKVFCNCDVEHASGKKGCGFFAKNISGPEVRP